MKKSITTASLILLTVIVFAGSVNAQNKLGIIGKQFAKQEADVLFGNVINSVKVNKVAMHYAVAKVKEYICFKIKNNRAYVLDENRISVLDETPSNPKERRVTINTGTPALPADEVVYFFSKSVVAEFLNNSRANEILIENRAEVLTLSDGLTILEYSGVCPPMCW